MSYTQTMGRKLTPEEREKRRLERLEQERIARFVARRIEGWRVVATFLSSSGSAIHTVERNGDEYRCTCQGFRIHKKGYCKHTLRAQDEGF